MLQSKILYYLLRVANISEIGSDHQNKKNIGTVETLGSPFVSRFTHILYSLFYQRFETVY